MKVIFICALLFVSSFAGTEQGPEASEEPKPESNGKNYKKYVGETVFPIPFLTKIISPLQEGQTVHAVGRVGPEPSRISISFQNGIASEADLPLQVLVLWDEGNSTGSIVYSTYINGSWSTSEQKLNNPFKADEEFDIRLRLLSGKVEVFANRECVGSFEQNFKLSDVDHIRVEGDLSGLHLFHYGGREFQLPFNAKVDLVPGKRLDIAAMPKGNYIDIEFYNQKHDQIVLRLAVRFKEEVVIRNSMLKNVWGKEEREGTLPISKDKVFDLTIINEPSGIQIFFNGERYATYAHRTSPSDVEVMKIDGKADVHSVTVNDAVSI